MKKVILGSMMFLAGLLSAVVLLAGTMANDWGVNGELSSFRNMVQYGLMPVFYIFIGVSVACGYFRKRRYGNGSMFSFVFCSQSIIFRDNRSVCGKRCEASVEPSGYFSSAISDRNMDIL